MNNGQTERYACQPRGIQDHHRIATLSRVSTGKGIWLSAKGSRNCQRIYEPTGTPRWNEVNRVGAFHVTISTEGQPFSWSGFFGKDLEGLGMAYCSKYKCWYWHNRLEKERDLDLRDARIIGTFIRKRDTFVDI